MTLQELQKQALQMSTSDRWQLVQALLESLKQDTQPKHECLTTEVAATKTKSACAD